MGRGPRCRWPVEPGHWGVRARVERFVEPCLLLLLRERPMHGYELLEHCPELAAGERGVDLGNLYRILRGLENEGIVASEWQADVPGPRRVLFTAGNPRSTSTSVATPHRMYAEMWHGYLSPRQRTLRVGWRALLP